MKKKKKMNLPFQSTPENVQKRRWEKERKNLNVSTALILKLTNDQLKIDTEKARKRIAVCFKIASEKASCENWRAPI